MNVYTLDTLSLQYIRRPIDDIARNELSEFFCTAYNEIYRRIMSDPYKLSLSQTVTLDEENSFSVNKLSKSLIRIKKITSTGNVKLMWERADDDCIKVHTVNKNVIVNYFYMPELLSNKTPTVIPTKATNTNTPVIPSEYHNIFSLWAAYRYMHSRRKSEDANYYYEMAMELFYKIKNDYGEKTKITVNYFD